MYRDVTKQTPPITTPTSLDITSSKLSIIKDTYCRHLNNSSNWKSRDVDITNSQLLPPMTGFIIPLDWPHLPLTGDYNQKYGVVLIL